MPKHIHLSRIIATTITVLGCVSVTGCAAVSAVGAVASMAGSAMEAAGLKKPENAPIEVKLAIHSGENLNASSGQAMAVVTKIYYLKNPESFQRTPPAQLIDTAQEKAALGETMLASRELTLTPGQRYENIEKVPKEAEYIAIAGLFYAPAPMRWKYVFRVKDVEDSGIVLGAHACALSVTTGKPTLPAGIPPYDPSRLSGVQCPG